MTGKKRRRRALLWFGLVGFLLIIPPFLPMAIMSDKPLLYSSIAIGYALVFGTAIWMIANAMEDQQQGGE